MIPRSEPFSAQRVEGLLRRVQTTQLVRNRGRVIQLIGLVIESEGPMAAVGEICRIESARHDGSTLAEVVGFRNHHVLLMPLGDIEGIHPGSEVVALGSSLQVPVGEGLKGRVIDGLGNPLDDKGPIEAEATIPCLLYTSDAADDLLCVDLGGRRIIKKK